jgi:hypothetical protein
MPLFASGTGGIGVVFAWPQDRSKIVSRPRLPTVEETQNSLKGREEPHQIMPTNWMQGGSPQKTSTYGRNIIRK